MTANTTSSSARPHEPQNLADGFGAIVRAGLHEPHLQAILTHASIESDRKQFIWAMFPLSFASTAWLFVQYAQWYTGSMPMPGWVIVFAVLGLVASCWCTGVGVFSQRGQWQPPEPHDTIAKFKQQQRELADDCLAAIERKLGPETAALVRDAAKPEPASLGDESSKTPGLDFPPITELPDSEQQSIHHLQQLAWKNLRNSDTGALMAAWATIGSSMTASNNRKHRLLIACFVVQSLLLAVLLYYEVLDKPS